MLKIYKFWMVMVAAFLTACGGGGGLPGSQTGDAQLRVYPPISAVTVPVGAGYAAVEIRGGDRPYAVFSNHPAISVTLVDGNIMQIRALAAIESGSTGTAGGTTPKAWFTDKNGIKTVEIQVSTFTIPLNNTIPGSIVLLPNETRSGVVSSGFAPYTYSSANNGVATISGNSSGQYTITGVAAGSTTVQVTDAVGAKVTINVEVRSAPVVELEVTPASGSGRVGSSLVFDIKGGVAPYTVLSNSPSVATASVSGRTLTVQLLLVGSTSLVVRDATGATKTVGVTATAIQSTPLIITPPSQEVADTSTADVVYTLGDGVPPFIPVVPLANQTLVRPEISSDNTKLTLKVGSQGNRCVTGDQTIVVQVFDQTGVGKNATLVIRDTGAACP